MFRLEPMSKATYAAWRVRIQREYGQQKVEAGNWKAEEAEALSQQSFDELLPQGLGTQNHQLQSMVNDDGEVVGIAWFVPEDREMGRVTFIYDIEVGEAHRRNGYAGLALAEIEAFARENGCLGVMLHVFGDNEGARALYRKAGYVETNVLMLKRVDG